MLETNKFANLMVFVATLSTKSEQKPIIIIKMKTPNPIEHNNAYLQSMENEFTFVDFFMDFNL